MRPSPIQNCGLLSKYTSIKFNILAFITNYAGLSLEKILTKTKILAGKVSEICLI